MKSKKLLLLAIVIFILNTITAQDFYLSELTNKIVTIYKPIKSDWANININEAYELLQVEGFGNIKTTTADDKEMVSGSIFNEEYLLTRALIFKEKVIVGYVDNVVFTHICMECFSNETLKKIKGGDDDVMRQFLLEKMPESIEKDKATRKSVLNEYLERCEKEELIFMKGKVNEETYDVAKYNNINSDVKITRTCKVELENTTNIFRLSKLVILNERDVIVGQYNLKDVDTYDLPKMIEIFLIDCKIKGLIFPKNTIDVKFEALEGDIIGLSYAKDNDKLIKIRVDPKAWSEASGPKKWYLLYHELGHDVLNLDHGHGGKMMFNFADRGYSWNEFLEDKNYMLNNYKK